MKRLSQPTGEIADNDIKKDDSKEKIVRPAILVHAGANGKKITFMSGDGEIQFDAERIKNIVRNQNKMIKGLAKQYGGLDKMPIGAYPPILDQHKNDSGDRIIGRLASLLRFEVRNVPKVGNNVPCAVADITFLGEDSVKKVLDGRVYHLSIGIDEATDTLGETSAVIEPAAPGAMLLKKKSSVIKKTQGDLQMSKKRLEAHKSRMTHLESIKKSLKEMSAKLVKSSETISLSKRQGAVITRLSACIKAGKITPAEYKKMDLKKLSALPEDALNTVMEMYESLEPKVLIGQRGTTDAVDFASMGKSLEKRQQKRLKSEIADDFKRLTGKKLAGVEEESEEKELAMPEMPQKEEAKMQGEGEQAADEAKLSDVKSEDYKASMEGLQKELDEVKTQLARMAGMVDKLYSVEKEEGHDLAQSEEEVEMEGEGVHVDINSHDAEMTAEEKVNAKVDEKLAAASDEEAKKLAQEEEEKKKLAAEEDAKKLAADEEAKKLAAEEMKEEAKKVMKKKLSKKDGEKA